MKSTIWRLPEHTRAKHRLLQNYLKAWFPILSLSQRQGRVIFIDGFAGPGTYSDGEPGSPLIALETLVDHSHFGRFSPTEFVFLLVESDAERCQLLASAIDSYWNAIGGQPSNIRVEPIQEDFAAVAKRIGHIGPGRLAPTLAFVDPFGWSGVPLTTIGELLSSDKCEVIFNFMFDQVNRFVNDERPGIANSFAELFGTSENEHRRAGALSGIERRTFLRDLYAKQLRLVAKFSYVSPFEIMDVERNRTAYYLMFGTRSLKGLEVMKDAMWELDPINGARFSGFVAEDELLFRREPDYEPLRADLTSRFAQSTVVVDDIEQFVLAATRYKATHYKGILRELEQRGLIRCHSARQKRFTYPSGTVLEFLETPEQPELFSES